VLAGKAYLTLLGRSTWALINTYYSFLIETGFCPNLIHVFTEEPYKEHLEKTQLALEILSNEHNSMPDFQQTILPSSDFIEAGKHISKLVTELKTDGYKVAIDITDGRKALVVGTLLSISNLNVDHVLYLSMDSLDDVSKPYMMIPLQIQHLRDFIEDAKRVQK